MESFLRRKLTQTCGNILGGSSLQKPVSSYQTVKLPDLCSSFYSVADEPFPQVSGFLDDTQSISLLSNDVGTVLNSPGCTQSESQAKNKLEGVLASRKEAVVDSVLNCSVGVDSQLTDGSICTRSQQNEKDISATADKAHGPCNSPTVSTMSLEKSDFRLSAELKNGTFNVTQDLKEQSDIGVNVSVDLQNIRETNNTFNVTQELKEQSDIGVNVSVDLQNIRETNNTFNVTQELKEQSDIGVNVSVDLQNIKEKNGTFNVTQELKEQSDPGVNVSVDLHNVRENNGTFNVTQELKEQSDPGVNVSVDLHNVRENNRTFNVTQELKEQSDIGVNVSVDLQNIREKNNTFNVTQELKEQSDPGVNVSVVLQNIREKNGTFESQESKERPDPRVNSSVDNDVPNIKMVSGNATVDLVQLHESKGSADTDVNVTVDIPNLDSAHAKTNSSGDNSAPLNTTTEKLEETKDLQPQERPKGSLASTERNKIRDTVEANLKVNVTDDIVEQMAIASHQPSDEIEQSSSDILKPANINVTKPNISTDLTPPEVPVLKDTTVEIKPSSTQLTDQVNGASNSVPITNSRETEVKMSTSACVCSALSSETSLGSTEEHHEKTDTLGLAEVEAIPSSEMGNISRNSIFCLDDTLDMKSSFMVTSTPIVVGREPRFEMPRESKPTPSRRLSVINSIEIQSSDDVSNHHGTDAVQATERSSKLSVNCISSHSTSEPANENKPPTKPIKRRLPQPSSKISYTKSSLPPRPQSSTNSYPRKNSQAPQALHHPSTSTTLLDNRKSVLMNKGKYIAPVKNTASSSTVKTSVISSVSGCNFTAVAKPSSSGIPQVKPSGLQPLSHKRLTARTTQSSLETVQTQPSNKSTSGLAGMRRRVNSLLPSTGQTRINNVGLPSAKRKRNAQAALSTVESDAVHSSEGAHESGCVKCLPLQEKLESVLQELMGLCSGLCSECKNCSSLHEKLEMCAREIKMRKQK